MDRASLDWENLGFGLVPTDYNLRYRWKDGVWSPQEVSRSADLTLPLAAVALHYGQALFEGLKAFETEDGRAVVFRPDQNARRMAAGARKLMMQPPPEELFVEAVLDVVRLNRRFLPPGGSSAALYIRPLLIGTSAQVGVRPANEYLFSVFVTPVGPYFRGDARPLRIKVEEESNRAAPRGVGDVKAAGNYAAGMRASAAAKVEGYDGVLYLDAREGRFVDELGAANFVGISEQGDDVRYVTPRSLSILESVTNDSLMTLAADLGMTVERRPLDVAELPDLSEAGACGTAATLVPVGSIQHGSHEITYGTARWIPRLRSELLGIQRGHLPDRHAWLREVPR